MDRTRDIEDLSIQPCSSIIAAMQQMDRVRRKLLMVVEKDHFMGILSIGAIQRALVRGTDPRSGIGEIMRRDSIVCSVDDSDAKIRAEMMLHRTEYMPIVDAISGEKTGVRICRLVFWEDLFGDFEHKRGIVAPYNLPVVVMAGGEGSRLRPLTNILPKPLLPIGEKTIVETIMDRFSDIGCKRFFMSLNYKADMIEQYMTAINKGQYEITFFRETKPLGTGGSLSLLKGQIKGPFFVTNCDNVLNQDLAEVVEYHRSNHNEMTVVAAVKDLQIPYGNLVVEKANGVESVTRIEEKPEFVFRVNTGVYILEPQLLAEIPNDTFYQITDLVETVVKRGGRVGCFPITDGSWCDIGNWEDYRKAIGQ